MVDAQKELLDHMDVVNYRNYDKQYAHWRESPEQVDDRHPNERAHKIIACNRVKNKWDIKKKTNEINKLSN